MCRNETISEPFGKTWMLNYNHGVHGVLILQAITLLCKIGSGHVRLACMTSYWLLLRKWALSKTTKLMYYLLLMHVLLYIHMWKFSYILALYKNLLYEKFFENFWLRKLPKLWHSLLIYLDECKYHTLTSVHLYM